MDELLKRMPTRVLTFLDRRRHMHPIKPKTPVASRAAVDGSGTTLTTRSLP